MVKEINKSIQKNKNLSFSLLYKIGGKRNMSFASSYFLYSISLKKKDDNISLKKKWISYNPLIKSEENLFKKSLFFTNHNITKIQQSINFIKKNKEFNYKTNPLILLGPLSLKLKILYEENNEFFNSMPPILEERENWNKNHIYKEESLNKQMKILKSVSSIYNNYYTKQHNIPILNKYLKLISINSVNKKGIIKKPVNVISYNFYKSPTSGTFNNISTGFIIKSKYFPSSSKKNSNTMTSGPEGFINKKGAVPADLSKVYYNMNTILSNITKKEDKKDRYSMITDKKKLIKADTLARSITKNNKYYPLLFKGKSNFGKGKWISFDGYLIKNPVFTSIGYPINSLNYLNKVKIRDNHFCVNNTNYLPGSLVYLLGENINKFNQSKDFLSSTLASQKIISNALLIQREQQSLSLRKNKQENGLNEIIKPQPNLNKSLTIFNLIDLVKKNNNYLLKSSTFNCNMSAVPALGLSSIHTKGDAGTAEVLNQDFKVIINNTGQPLTLSRIGGGAFLQRRGNKNIIIKKMNFLLEKFNNILKTNNQVQSIKLNKLYLKSISSYPLSNGNKSGYYSSSVFVKGVNGNDLNNWVKSLKRKIKGLKKKVLVHNKLNIYFKKNMKNKRIYFKLVVKLLKNKFKLNNKKFHSLRIDKLNIFKINEIISKLRINSYQTFDNYKLIRQLDNISLLNLSFASPSYYYKGLALAGEDNYPNKILKINGLTGINDQYKSIINKSFLLEGSDSLENNIIEEAESGNSINYFTPEDKYKTDFKTNRFVRSQSKKNNVILDLLKLAAPNLDYLKNGVKESAILNKLNNEIYIKLNNASTNKNNIKYSEYKILSRTLMKKEIYKKYNKTLLLPNSPLLDKDIILNKKTFLPWLIEKRNNKGKNLVNKIFNKWESKKYIKDIYKFLSASFKSISCLISNPILISTPNKVKIQLFYYLLLPNLLKKKKRLKNKIKLSFVNALSINNSNLALKSLIRKKKNKNLINRISSKLKTKTFTKKGRTFNRSTKAETRGRKRKVIVNIPYVNIKNIILNKLNKNKKKILSVNNEKEMNTYYSSFPQGRATLAQTQKKNKNTVIYSNKHKYSQALSHIGVRAGIDKKYFVTANFPASQSALLLKRKRKDISQSSPLGGNSKDKNIKIVRLMRQFIIRKLKRGYLLNSKLFNKYKLSIFKNKNYKIKEIKKWNLLVNTNNRVSSIVPTYNNRHNKTNIQNKSHNQSLSSYQSEIKKKNIMISNTLLDLISKKILKNKKYVKLLLRRKKIRRNSSLFRNRLSRKKRLKRLRRIRKLKFQIKIRLMKLSYFNLVKNYPKKFNRLCQILSFFFQKPVEFDLIRLHYPYNNNKILVNFLAILINKMRAQILIRKLFNKTIFLRKNMEEMMLNNFGSNTLINSSSINNNNLLQKKSQDGKKKVKKINTIPSFLSGMTIKVAGKIDRKRVRPRIAPYEKSIGSNAKGNVQFIDFARYTNKTKRGSYSITIYSSHNLY